jgi:C1A family cysteine protease
MESFLFAEVRSQGSCGGCWAITAVETVESATFIATSKLYTLSETEVIVCTQDCEMCSGGWPQDAFEYIMEHNGVPLRSDMSYNANFLYQITAAKSGESDEIECVKCIAFSLSNAALG